MLVLAGCNTELACIPGESYLATYHTPYLCSFMFLLEFTYLLMQLKAGKVSCLVNAQVDNISMP